MAEHLAGEIDAPIRFQERRVVLLARVWGREYVDEVDYIRVYIRRLRAKLGDDPERPRYIQTERGLGYRFLPPR